MFDSAVLIIMGLLAGASILDTGSTLLRLGIVASYALLVWLYFNVALPYHEQGAETIEIDY